MARINVEDKWWNDPRRRLLRILLQRDAADQVAINAWRTGYDYWCDRKGCSLIPGSIFIHFDGWQELIQSGLAILYRDTVLVHPINFRTHVEHLPTPLEQNSTDVNTVKQCHVYLCGMRDALFNFMSERAKKTLAGKESAKKRLELYGFSQPKLEHTPNTSEHKSTAPNYSSSPSSSPSSSKKKKNTLVGIRTDYPPEFETIWNAYGKRGDKKAALQEYQKLGLQGEELPNLSQAITNYVKCTPELQYRMHLSRFLKTDWREWIHSSEGVSRKRLVPEYLGASS